MSTAKTSITPHDAAEIARNLEGEPPEEILRFVVETFGATNVTLACSFQAEDIVLVDMISRISEEVRVFSLDTGFLFSETEKTQKVVESRYNLPFETIRPASTGDNSICVTQTCVASSTKFSLWRELSKDTRAGSPAFGESNHLLEPTLLCLDTTKPLDSTRQIP